MTAVSGTRNTGKVVRIAAAVVVIALAAAACGGGGKKGGSNNSNNSNTTATNPPDEGKPKYGGNLNYGIEAESDGLNPTTNRFAAAGVMMGRAVFDPLFMFDKDGAPKPFLAESVSHSDDFKHWTIKLRPGIKFTDGTPLDSTAAKAAIEGILNDPLVSLAVKNILDAGPDGKDPTRAMTVVDDLTATLNLQVADAGIPSALTGQLGYIPSPKWLAAAKADKALNQCPVGTGPFMLTNCSDRQVGSKTVMHRNPNYWNKDADGSKLPYLDSITFIVQEDGQTRGKNLDAGTLDIMHTTRAEDVARYRKDPNVRKWEDSTGEEAYLMMNEAKPPFDDIRVRKAIAEGTDRDAYIKLLGAGVLQKANGIFAPGTKWYTPVTNFPKYNPADAKKLITEYCADKPASCDGGKLKISYKTTPGSDNDLTYQTMVGFWSDFATTTKTPVEQSQFVTDVAIGNYNIVLFRQFGALDPDYDTIWIWSKSITSLVSINWPRNNDPKIDQYIVDQRATQDFATRKQIWQKINTQLNVDLPYVWLNHDIWDVVASKKVHNVDTYTLPDGSVGMPLFSENHSLAQIWIS